MKKKPAGHVSVRDIALAAGVSKSTAGNVLGNKPGPSRSTCELVQRIARRMGYVPDARVTSWMATVRSATEKQFLPIAWLNTHYEKDSWHRNAFQTPYRLGMMERCHELGYRIEEIWAGQPDLSMRRLSQILYQRGIEGVVITLPATHLRLGWDRIAAVCIGTELLAPRLHRVVTDVIFNLLLAIKMLKRFGYQRIGVCFSVALDRCTNQTASATMRHLASQSGSRFVPPLFYKDEHEGGCSPRKQILDWIRRHRVDVVVGFDAHLVEWLEKAGWKVPRQIGVVHLSTDDDVLDWSGIYANRREIGRTAAEHVISLVQNRQFGIPRIAHTISVRGTWQHGRTLLVPKPR